MRRRGVPIAICASLAVVLAACSFYFETKVTGSLAERIAFEFFFDGQPANRLRIYSVEVTEIFDDHAEPIWLIQGTMMRDRVWFGLEPEGMKGKPESRPLRPGGTYEVDVRASFSSLTWSGPGHSSAAFRIREDGRPEPASFPRSPLPRRCRSRELDGGLAPEPAYLGTLCP